MRFKKLCHTQSFRKKISILLGLVFTGLSFAQTKEVINELDASCEGRSIEQAQLIFERAKVFPNNTVLSMAWIRDGEVHFVGIERMKDSIRWHTNQEKVFEIGSITKVFTATLLASLVEEGVVGLDDSVQDYLDFPIGTKDTIRIRHLANHTSGLPRLPTNLNFQVVDPENPYKAYNAKLLQTYLSDAIQLETPPGEVYSYSNLGAGLLGFLLAQTTGKSYECLLQKRILEKHKMSHSSTLNEKIKGHLVMGLSPEGEPIPNWEFDALAGAGAIRSSVSDLARFALAQFNEQNAAIQRTHQPTFEINQNMRIGLGWLLIKRQNGKEWLWHNGGTGGYTSSMFLDVEQKNGIILLSNVSVFHPRSSNIDELALELMKTLYSSQEKDR